MEEYLTRTNLNCHAAAFLYVRMYDSDRSCQGHTFKLFNLNMLIQNPGVQRSKAERTTPMLLIRRVLTMHNLLLSLRHQEIWLEKSPPFKDLKGKM